ncbi:hybrid sensor histidine kinase/response regulator [Paenibacillus sp. FSL P4-0081]|uniref:hybrid sensor histidine kinase/response regulator n=1 Tax=Paenibacillus sp. FSL P4-0081 TaxID=1536769 RepID=UPI000AC1F61A|nr:ATP-binding protein [Paenibacillus sp. FSL P4-0081]
MSNKERMMKTNLRKQTMINTKSILNLKHALLLLLYLTLLISIRYLWFNAYEAAEHPEAKQGVLDMRGWDFENSRSVRLDGEWEFYPGQFLTYESFAGQPPDAQQVVQVPGDWSSGFPEEGHSSFGYGTYRLRILVDPSLQKPYGFWIQRIQAASSIEVNGQTEGSFGQLAANRQDYKPEAVSYTAAYNAAGQQEITLLVRAANYDHPLEGGIVRSIRFGSQAAVDTERMYSIGFQMVTFVIMLLHAMYAGILFFFNRRQKAFLVFFLLLLAVGASIVTDNDTLLLLWLPINYTWALKLKMLAYPAISLFMLLLTRSFSAQERPGRLLKGYLLVLSLYTVYILVLPAQYALYARPFFSVLYLLPVAGVVYSIGRMVARQEQDSVFLLFAAAAIGSSVLGGSLESSSKASILYYPVDVIAAIIGFSAYWFKRYFRNAEENRLLNQQLKESDHLKDQFLANTAHELRTPLHGIISIAQTVTAKEKSLLDHQSYQDLELLITISRRMSHMLNDLLDVTRLQEKRIVLQREPLAIGPLVTGILNMFEFMTDSKQLQLRNELPASLPPVWGDEKRIVQILYNLLRNAIKYTQAGTVTISAEVTGKTAKISVSDTGIGIDKETQARIFSPYEQGSKGINDGGGIGLGLSISKQLAELHGGDLTVDSEPGKGSMFTFTLPLASATEVRHAPEEAAAARMNDSPDMEDLLLEQGRLLFRQSDTSSITAVASQEIPSHPQMQLQETSMTAKTLILAVDDDPVNLKVLASILSDEQHQLVTVTSAQEALELLGTEPWDLLIADVMMPYMSGYELTRIARQRFSVSELPILLLTARNQPVDIYTGFLSGANDYVAKPVDALELKYRVRSLTGLKQSINQSLRLEAAYLQAQIQPHFLFNTLNALLALSEFDLPKMRDLGEAFSSYLRISFDYMNSQQRVGLSHELELVESYLFIEKARFDERLQIEWDVEPGIELLLPPLTLQPLVENAVRHGLLSRKAGGLLHIRIHRRQGYTSFEVEDNGKGMPDEQVLHLLDDSGLGLPSRGIGLLNTNRRLTQLYGQGLVIHSQLGAGTTVSFVIPERVHQHS